MKLLIDIRKWLVAVLSAWYGWFGASATVGIVSVGHEMQWWPAPTKKAYLVLMLIGLVISLFLAWRTEHIRAEEATAKLHDGRPIIMLEVFRQPVQTKSSDEELRWIAPSFTLFNCGGRTARFLRVESITSWLGSYKMYFSDMPSLQPGERKDISFRVNSSDWDDGEMAWKFLNDNYKDPSNPLCDAAVVWYDPKIEFRDTGESQMTDIVRLMFDVESEYLHVTEVPYTRRPPARPMKILGNSTRLRSSVSCIRDYLKR